MIIEMQLPQANWSGLPHGFPTPSGQSAGEWFDEFAGVYATAAGGLGPEQVGGLRDMVGEARAQISDRDVATLLFRPLDLPVHAVVHVQLYAAESDAAESISHALLPDVPMALPPRIERADHPTFGTGRKGMFLAGELIGDRAVSGVAYAFATDGLIVHVFTGPVAPPVLGLLEGSLDEVVSSMRLVPEDAPNRFS